VAQKHPWDKDPLEYKFSGDSTQAAVRYFEANTRKIYAALCEALQANVEAWEADQEEAAHRAREAAEDDRSDSEMVFGELFEDQRGTSPFDAYFDAVPEESVWERPAPKRSRAERAAAFRERFRIHTVTFFGGLSMGLTGSCDWDEEHGVGVMMDGLEIREIGDYSSVR